MPEPASVRTSRVATLTTRIAWLYVPSTVSTNEPPRIGRFSAVPQAAKSASGWAFSSIE